MKMNDDSLAEEKSKSKIWNLSLKSWKVRAKLFDNFAYTFIYAYCLILTPTKEVIFTNGKMIFTP